MGISKFIIGVLTIAIGLWAAGNLSPAIIKVGQLAVQAQKDHNDFKLGAWNRQLQGK